MARFAEYEPGRRATEAPADLRIREATHDDIPALAEIRASRGNVTAEQARAGFARSLERVANGEMLVLVAETAGTVAAFGCVARFDPPPGAPLHHAPAGWYLAGVVVAPPLRRRGIAAALTCARLDWIAGRAPEAYYFVHELNRASIDLHARFGFRELTRDFWHPDASFTGGGGILFVA